MPQDLIRRALMKIDKNYLPYEYFEQLQELKEYEIVEGITFIRLPTHKDLYFKILLEEGSNVNDHYHNSMEYFFIEKGRVILNDLKELTRGDKFTLEAFEQHNIKILEYTEMYVQFVKDESFKDFK